MHCFPLAPSLCRWKTKPVKSGSCGCSALLALPALQGPVSHLEPWGAGGLGSAGLCGVRWGFLGCWGSVLQGMGLLCFLGLLSGRRKGGKEGRSAGGSVLQPLFFPQCRVPGTWTGPPQHSCGHGGPAPTSQHQLLWQQAQVSVPRHVSITEGLLWLCLDCPCAVHPTPGLPVRPCHTAHGRWGAAWKVACAGGHGVQRSDCTAGL